MSSGHNRQRWIGPSFLALAASLAWPVGAEAADDAATQRLEEQIQQLEARHQAELKALQEQVQQLKAEQAEQQKQIQAQAPAPGTPRLIESPNHQFGLSSSTGENTIAILARLQLDYGNYLSVKPEGGVHGVGPGSPNDPLDSGVNARRARLGIGGTFANDWAYRLIYDFGASADSTTAGVSGGVTSGVENAYFTYNGFYKPANAVPVAMDAGYMDVPWTLDESTSSNDIMFLERSSAQVVATEFGGGDFRSAAGLRSNDQRYWAGAYLTGPTSGTPHHGADYATYATTVRATVQALQTDEASLHLGVNALHLFQPRANATTTTATGISTTIAPVNSLTLSDRPELRVDPTNILNTGAIPASSGSVLGIETAAAYEHLFAQGEYFHYIVSQYANGLNPTDGAVNKVAPDLNFDGGYVQASYSIGGRRRYIPETGAYSGVIPERPLSLSGDGWGALEVAARFSAVNLNDRFSPNAAPHLTGGVNGGNQKGYDFGINWYPNTNMKFMLDYIHTDVADLFKPVTTGKAPTAPAGAHVDAIAGRIQFAY